MTHFKLQNRVTKDIFEKFKNLDMEDDEKCVILILINFRIKFISVCIINFIFYQITMIFLHHK